MLQGTHILAMIFMRTYTAKIENMHLQHRICACNSYFVPPSLPNLGVQSVKSGVQFHLLSIIKPLISSCTDDEGITPAIIDGIMLMLLVFSSVVVGALLGIEFKNHDDEKRDKKTKSGK